MDSRPSTCPALGPESLMVKGTANGVKGMYERPAGAAERAIPFAGPGMLETVASPVASSGMSATAAEWATVHQSMNMKRKAARPADNEQQAQMKRPRYARIMFGFGEISHTPSATYTETALPIPDPPDYELANLDLATTIRENPHLFAIVTPVKFKALGVIAAKHPNRPLVKSLCKGFEFGFWPYADTSSTEEGACSPNRTDRLPHEVLSFLRAQRDVEIELGQYSAPFPRLLPGMISQPIFAIPKPGSDNLHLINDHSAGNKSLNSLIPAEGGFMQLDTLQDLGLLICREIQHHGEQLPALVFKSDASQAYRRLPLHPHWQVRQATNIDGSLHVDHCAVFGNRASG
jgi:hypothetical protein